VRLSKEAQRVLEALSEWMQAVEAPGRSLLAEADARAVVLSAAASVSAVSLASRSLAAPALAAAIAFVAAGGGRWRALKVSAAWALFMAAVALPLIFMVPGEPVASLSLLGLRATATREGVLKAVHLVARVFGSVSMLLAMVVGAGAYRFIAGIAALGAPKHMVEALWGLFRLAPLQIRDMAKLLQAREARVLADTGLLASWRWASTAVSALLLKSFDRAHSRKLALEARAPLPEACCSGSPGATLAAIAPALALIAASLTL